MGGGRDALEAAAARLRSGGVAAFATDTVAGLGCLASSREGVEAIFSLKGRARNSPLTVFVAGPGECEAITGRLDPAVLRLLRLVWPGAFTAVLPLKGRWLPGVGMDGTIGVRVPAHQVPRDLVRMAGGPLATTSANASGEPPFADATEAGVRWPGRVSVVPGRSGSVPSTVADLRAWPPRILREGVIGAAMLAEFGRAAGFHGAGGRGCRGGGHGSIVDDGR